MNKIKKELGYRPHTIVYMCVLLLRRSLYQNLDISWNLQLYAKKRTMRKKKKTQSEQEKKIEYQNCKCCNNSGSATTQLEYACCFNTFEMRRKKNSSDSNGRNPPFHCELCSRTLNRHKGQRGKSVEQINYVCMYSAVNWMRSKLYGNSCATFQITSLRFFLLLLLLLLLSFAQTFLTADHFF